ncbi:IS481 family transposase [Methylohalobius crimeensis]|uniref:IS481 family transposase n=2 Tax=Methylohalobius crimeensis TaxID=244365 RepID=UPI0003B2F248|nr:IS481 family transposase [Methylohalobius crimeensis]
MQVRLHKNATTTPRIRALIQASTEPNTVLAKRFGVTVETIARWKGRDSVEDLPHTPHRLPTTLTPAQEQVVLVLRQQLDLSLDDLLAVVREFIHPTLTRASLHRMLKRHGVSRRPPADKSPPKAKAFKAYVPGFVHIDVKYLPQMADETRRRYLFVAIDRATRWVFVRLYHSKSARHARHFLAALAKTAPFKIEKILTDNGKEFTDRFVTRGERTPTGQHVFDQLCTELGIEHRLIRPKRPQTNGMVERFNGRIADILRTYHFRSGEELETTLRRYVWLYNHQVPQKALGHIHPVQALKNWQRSHPHLFHKRVVNHPGHDTYPL